MDHGLRATAEAIVADGKGILAADESTPTMRKRLAAVGVESTPETNLRYRSLLFTAPGLERAVGGVILFDETLRQSIDDVPVPAFLADRGILPGIKVDRGTVALAGHPDEKATEGLDGLRERLAEYAGLGARFAKWRAVLAVGHGPGALPSGACLAANATALAQYAALSQEAGLVPVVEPEVLMDGDHDAARCEAVTRRALTVVYEALRDLDVDLAGTLLKPNMVVSGSGVPADARAGPDEVAARTVATLLDCVPARVPGVCFLSGGLGPEEATADLRAINELAAAGPARAPWALSFSFGRALQQPALHAWAGDDDNREAVQRALLDRADANHDAVLAGASPS